MTYIAGKKTSADRIHIISEHIHAVQYVYPNLASAVTLTATNDATTWTLGTLVEVVPASTITSVFDIHYIDVSSASANTTYQIRLYYGAGDTECANAVFVKTSNFDPVVPTSIMTPLIPANSRIRAAVATPDDNGETIDMRIVYHTY